jgi:hypothetical protein
LKLQGRGDGELVKLGDGVGEVVDDDVDAGGAQASRGVFAGPEGDEDFEVGEAVLEAPAEVAGGIAACGGMEIQTTLQACPAICSTVSAARSWNAMTRG